MSMVLDTKTDASKKFTVRVKNLAQILNDYIRETLKILDI